MATTLHATHNPYAPVPARPGWSDRQRLAAMFTDHHHRLVALLTARTNDRDLANDLAQETLARAAANLDQLDHDLPVWPWLRATAINLAIDHHRKHRRELLTDELAVVVDPEHHEQDLTGQLDDRDLLARAIAQLPDRQQVAIRLRYLEDWKASEAGDFLDLSRPAVEQLLYRARKNLRATYQRLVNDTARRLAGLLLPLHRLKDSLLARFRARLNGWEPNLQAIGTTTLETIGQTAAALALLGLAGAAASGANSAEQKASVHIDGRLAPASSLLGQLEGDGSAPVPVTKSANTVGSPASTSAAPTTTRHVDLAAPSTDETNDVAFMSGAVDSTDSDDTVSIHATVDSHLGPTTPFADIPVNIHCSNGPAAATACFVVRTADDMLP